MDHQWKSITAKQLAEQTKTHIVVWDAHLDEIASVQTPTLANVLQPLIDIDTNFTLEFNVLSFYQFVSTDADVRKASLEAEKECNHWHVEAMIRRDVYAVFSQLLERIGAGEVAAPVPGSEEARFLQHQERTYRRAGMHLPDKELERVARYGQKINELSSDFINNLGEDTGHLWLTKRELAGLPADFTEGLEQHTKDDATVYKVTLKYPHYFPVMNLCSNAETRRRMNIAYDSRCVDSNTALLEHVLTLRHTMAQCLGYAT